MDCSTAASNPVWHGSTLGSVPTPPSGGGSLGFALVGSGSTSTTSPMASAPPACTSAAVASSSPATPHQTHSDPLAASMSSSTQPAAAGSPPLGSTLEPDRTAQAITRLAASIASNWPRIAPSG